MFQTIDGVECYVVDLKEMPERPITSGGIPALVPYAQALDAALAQGIVTKPGKYAINITDSGKHWNVFKILE